MVVQAGIVAMKKDSDEVARLAPGDFFGEQGTLSGVTLQAATRVVVYDIDNGAFPPLLRDWPELAEELAANLAYREQIGERSSTPSIQDERLRLDLLKRIRSMFDSRWNNVST